MRKFARRLIESGIRFRKHIVIGFLFANVFVLYFLFSSGRVVSPSTILDVSKGQTSTTDILMLKDDSMEMAEYIVTDAKNTISDLRSMSFSQIVRQGNQLQQLGVGTGINWGQEKFFPREIIFLTKPITEGGERHVVYDCVVSPSFAFWIAKGDLRFSNAVTREREYEKLLGSAQAKAQAFFDVEVIRNTLKLFSQPLETPPDENGLGGLRFTLNGIPHEEFGFPKGVEEFQMMRSYAGAHASLMHILETLISNDTRGVSIREDMEGERGEIVGRIRPKNPTGKREQMLAVLGRQRDYAANSWPMLYQSYYVNRHPNKIRWGMMKLYWEASMFYLLLLPLPFLLCQSALSSPRSMATRYIQEKYGLSLSSTVLTGLEISLYDHRARYLVWQPLRTSRVTEKLFPVCDGVVENLLEQQVSMEVSSAAEELFELIKEQFTQTPGPEVLGLHAVAVNPARRLDHRKDALHQLTVAHEKMVENALASHEPKGNGRKRKSKRVSTPSNRSSLLARLGNIFPEINPRHWYNFSDHNLEVFMRFVETCREENNEEAISWVVALPVQELKIALRRGGKLDRATDVVSMMKTISSLRAGETSVSEKSEHPVDLVLPDKPLEGQKVMLIWDSLGGRQKTTILRAITDLGAIECKYVTPDDIRSVQSAADGDRYLFVLQRWNVNHMVEYAVKQRGGRIIKVHAKNASRLQQEIRLAFASNSPALI